MGKLFIVGFLALALLFPLLAVYGLVSERENRRNEAVREIGGSWALPQTVIGPMVDIPYHERWKDAEGGETRTATATLLPAELRMVGGVVTEVRRRGIFEAILFEADLELTGSFSRPQLGRFYRAFFGSGLCDVVDAPARLGGRPPRRPAAGVGNRHGCGQAREGSRVQQMTRPDFWGRTTINP